jgi:hypothetical protein
MKPRKHFVWMIMSAILSLCDLATAGPLRVLPSNPRYFTDGSGKAIYLTGSHTYNQWGNDFDYANYLNFLNSYNQNFIRLWSGDYSLQSSPSPYTIVEGKADLDHLNQAYFDRIYACAKAAKDRGIYVAVNLFPLDTVKRVTDWDSSFFNVSNNLQRVQGDPNGDGLGIEAYNLSIPAITAYQEAFGRRLIETLNDLDNVLYEIGNEGDWSSIPLQNHLIDVIRTYESGKPKQHPV